jgi:hypothetical protein
MNNAPDFDALDKMRQYAQMRLLKVYLKQIQANVNEGEAQCNTVAVAVVAAEAMESADGISAATATCGM